MNTNTKIYVTLYPQDVKYYVHNVLSVYADQPMRSGTAMYGQPRKGEPDDFDPTDERTGQYL